MPFSKESLLERLSAARGAGRLAHAYLFTGPSGSGKFWLAIRLGALELGCRLENAPTHPDMHIVQPESKSRRIVTEQIRILATRFTGSPFVAEAGSHLIQDADRMQIQAANVFLKTLEEPPSGSLILLLSARPRAVLPTIRSRCLETVLPGATPAQSEEQLSVLGALEEASFRGSSAWHHRGLSLHARVSGRLSRLRDRISSKYENALNKEIAHYKKASEDSSWFEERIAQTKALIEAEALRERDHMVETLLAALGEGAQNPARILVRRSCGQGDCHENRDQAVATATRLAGVFAPPSCPRRSGIPRLGKRVSGNGQKQPGRHRELSFQA